MTSNKRYTKEYKEKILNSLMPPQSKTVSQIVKEEGINRNTVYGWIRKARNEGASIPNSSPSHQKKWRKEDKFKMVMETYSMNEAELSAYCRKHGLYVSEIKRWVKKLEESLDEKVESAKLNEEKQRTRKLEKELKRKEKALAEAAALLVLRKKADAIWGDKEED